MNEFWSAIAIAIVGVVGSIVVAYLTTLPGIRALEVQRQQLLEQQKKDQEEEAAKKKVEELNNAQSLTNLAMGLIEPLKNDIATLKADLASSKDRENTLQKQLKSRDDVLKVVILLVKQLVNGIEALSLQLQGKSVKPVFVIDREMQEQINSLDTVVIVGAT